MNVKLPRSSNFATPGETVADAELELFLVKRHDEIEAKLQLARLSIARGEAVPLEPLEVLLREARDRAKAAR